jgi:hypothetical protein
MTATPLGFASCAAVAGPPSPHGVVPLAHWVPVPANGSRLAPAIAADADAGSAPQTAMLSTAATMTVGRDIDVPRTIRPHRRADCRVHDIDTVKAATERRWTKR